MLARSTLSERTRQKAAESRVKKDSSPWTRQTSSCICASANFCDVVPRDGDGEDDDGDDEGEGGSDACTVAMVLDIIQTTSEDGDFIGAREERGPENVDSRGAPCEGPAYIGKDLEWFASDGVSVSCNTRLGAPRFWSTATLSSDAEAPQLFHAKKN